MDKKQRSRIVTLGFILWLSVFVSLAKSETKEEDEKRRLLNWAASEGLREPILNEDGLPVLEVERINFQKLTEYNRKCDDAGQRAEGVEAAECEALKSKIVKELEDMNVHELSDYLVKRKQARDEM